MGKYIFVVFSSVFVGKEVEYNCWYDEDYIGDLLKVFGVVLGCRYDVMFSLLDKILGRYFVIYEIEVDDLDVVVVDILCWLDMVDMFLMFVIDMFIVQIWLYCVCQLLYCKVC